MEFLLFGIVEICLLLCAVLCTLWAFICVLSKKYTVAKKVTIVLCCVNFIQFFIWLIDCALAVSSSADYIFYPTPWIGFPIIGLMSTSSLLLVLKFEKRDQALSKKINILLYISIILMCLGHDIGGGFITILIVCLPLELLILKKRLPILLCASVVFMFYVVFDYLSLGSSYGFYGFFILNTYYVTFFTLWALTFTLGVSVKKSEIGMPFKKWLPKTNNEDNKIEELKKAKELLDAGVITQEEFDAKKKQILGL